MFKRISKLKSIFLLIFILFNFALDVKAQCGNCRPSNFSLFYNYLVPNQVKAYTNPYFQAQSVVNTVRNPRSILSPCNPVNRYIPGGALTTNLIYSYGPHHQPNSIQPINQFIPSANNVINESAYISNFNTNNPSQTQGDSYFDSSTNSYVWVLPEQN